MTWIAYPRAVVDYLITVSFMDLKPREMLPSLLHGITGRRRSNRLGHPSKYNVAHETVIGSWRSS